MLTFIRYTIVWIAVFLLSFWTGYAAWTMSPYAYELRSDPIVKQTETVLKIALMDYISQNYKTHELYIEMNELNGLVCPFATLEVSDRLRLDSDSITREERKILVNEKLLFQLDDIRTYIIDRLCFQSINIQPNKWELLDEDDINFIKNHAFPNICNLWHWWRLCH